MLWNCNGIGINTRRYWGNAQSWTRSRPKFS